jgi:hypothetical protein
MGMHFEMGFWENIYGLMRILWEALYNFQEACMNFEEYSFGSIQIDGTTYDDDVIIDRGEISKRPKKQSKKYREDFGHTPISLDEEIPWKCKRLVIGTGMSGSMPVMDEVRQEAKRRKVQLVILPTTEAIDKLRAGMLETNAILHLTC